MRKLLDRYRAMSDEEMNRLSLALMFIFAATWVLPELWAILAPYLQTALSPPPPAGPRA